MVRERVQDRRGQPRQAAAAPPGPGGGSIVPPPGGKGKAAQAGLPGEGTLEGRDSRDKLPSLRGMLRYTTEAWVFSYPKCIEGWDLPFGVHNLHDFLYKCTGF